MVPIAHTENIASFVSYARESLQLCAGQGKRQKDKTDQKWINMNYSSDDLKCFEP